MASPSLLQVRLGEKVGRTRWTGCARSLCFPVLSAWNLKRSSLGSPTQCYLQLCGFTTLCLTRAARGGVVSVSWFSFSNTPPPTHFHHFPFFFAPSAWTCPVSVGLLGFSAQNSHGRVAGLYPLSLLTICFALYDS